MQQVFRGVAITTPIKVARVHPLSILPTVNHEHDAGIDFYAYEKVVIPPLRSSVVDTGISIAIPTDCVGLLWPKGKSDYLIGAGVVDWTYQGTIKFKIINWYPEDYLHIAWGEALGQMVLVKNESPAVLEVPISELFSKQTKRGSSGGIDGTSLSE